ncbi:hypothetical protein HHK36_027796 [Tetracentron sinense]|uniref:Cytochrome P450 n=1 Tax=Tetracentron sinense TaxID=13715 RepID=A0A834YFG7_TETSI|nr:hypothetical protein HHK36_027796 [Tetracentron sinense]
MAIMDQTSVRGEINLFFPILLLLPLLLLILKYIRTPSPLKSPPLPPGPYPWPIIGNILDMGKMPHLSLSRLAQSYGPLISLRLGTQLLVVGSSPAVATEILKTHDRILSARYVPNVIPAKSPELSHTSLGWATECNNQWKYVRTVCQTELFSSKAIKSQASLREKKVMEMVGFLGTKEGKVVGVGEVVLATALNVLSSLLVSKDVINLEDRSVVRETNELVYRIMEITSAPNLSDFYPNILGGFDIQNLRKESMGLCVRVCAWWVTILKDRRDGKGGDVSSQRDFLDVLIHNTFSDDQINHLLVVRVSSLYLSLSLSLFLMFDMDPDKIDMNVGKFSATLHKEKPLLLIPKELITAGTDTSSSTIEWAMSELMKNPEAMKKVLAELEREIDQNELFTAGSATSSTTIEWAMTELMKNQEVMKKLREELTREIKEIVIKDSNLPHLSYLNACVKETLRLHPPAPFLLPHCALDSCKPEWFLNSDLDFKGNDFKLLPFGEGRRICPGLPMAANQIPLILASLIHFFDWSLPQEMDPDKIDMNVEKFSATLHKEKPLPLIPKGTILFRFCRYSLKDVRVSNLIYHDTRTWNVDLLERLVSGNSIVEIKKIPISALDALDRRIWHFSKSSTFKELYSSLDVSNTKPQLEDHSLIKWVAPEWGWVKINVNGAAISGGLVDGAGVVARDHLEVFLFRRRKPLGGDNSRQTEGEAIRLGLQSALDFR